MITLFMLSNILHAGEVRIAVSANVSHAMKDLKEQFERSHPDIRVETILGSSGKLTAQIMHGAPYDMFLSADMKYPEALYAAKIALTQPSIYAQGSLVYFSLNPKDFSKGIALLKDKNIKKIAIANAKTAPYGIAAKEALEHAQLYEFLKDKFVYGESISQTISYVKSSAADIGLVAKSSLFSPYLLQYKKNINWLEVDVSLYTPINQGMVILKHAKDNVEVKIFYDFMLTNEAKVILEKYGYKIL